MKKLLPVSYVLLLTVVFVACKPKQNCDCTYKDSAGNAHSVRNEIIGSSKSRAKDQCKTFQDLLTSQGKISASCAIQ